MGKAKREAKKARRAARGTEREQAYEAQDVERAKRTNVRRAVLVAIVPLTLVVASVLYWGVENRQAAGVSILVGAMFFFLYGLGVVGGSVKPRSDGSAGSIDFGRRR